MSTFGEVLDFSAPYVDFLFKGQISEKSCIKLARQFLKIGTNGVHMARHGLIFGQNDAHGIQDVF